MSKDYLQFSVPKPTPIWLYSLPTVYPIITPHCMHRLQRCCLLLLMFCGLCVCLLYICTWPWALLKQLNQLRCHWNVDSGWHNKPCFIWGPGSPQVKGKFGGRLLQCSLSSKFFDCLCKPGDVPGPDQTWNNSRKGWLNKCRMRNQQLLNVFTYLLHWYVEVQWYTNQSHRVLTRRHNGSVSFLA